MEKEAEEMKNDKNLPQQTDRDIRHINLALGKLGSA